MADEFQTSGNWWDSSRTATSSSALNSLGSFGNWSSTTSTDMVDIKSRSSLDSGTAPSMVFHDTLKLQQAQDSSSAAGAGDHNLQMMMGLGLSSQAMDWNQAALFRGENKAASEASSFRSILLEENNMNSSNGGGGNNFQQEITSSSGGGQLQWSRQDPKLLLFPGDSTSNDTSFKQMNRATTTPGFSLDHHHHHQPHHHPHHEFSPQYSSGDGSTVTCQQGGGLANNNNNSSSFQVDSAALYGSPSAILLQGLFGPDNQITTTHSSSSNLAYNSPPNYGVMMSTAAATTASNEVLAPMNSSNWSSNSAPTNKLPQFLRTSPPKQQPPTAANYSHLQFSNNAPFWSAPEAAAATAIKDVRSNFFSTLAAQPQFPTNTFDEKPKNISEVRDHHQSGGVMAKKSGNEAASNKRPRNDQTQSPLPAFKVRKEKMGDRITALQQLVSPFGKTDTASVLSEAIEYIKFLHEQVLSNPYMKSGAAIQHLQNNSDKSKDSEDPKQDLRSRGLCLVPVSSTFPMTHETAVDFWTPTFGGTFR
ncbi:transcription factor bHLH123-like isoform X2 [Humulus lupulus]|uniref:transcription factor bHLH123-like isoform X2 n=1 Tax=Humulus lupulus TaxID=3486 RepID=UPI002B41732E|nr:transcription factor bHLH123-like isoform X2 [Humulus lupulus]